MRTKFSAARRAKSVGASQDACEPKGAIDKIKVQERTRDAETEQASGHDSLDAIGRAVSRSGLTHDSFVRAITATAFGRLVAWSQLDLERLLLTAERIGVDPVGGEIYAVPGQDHSHATEAKGQVSSQLIELVLSVDGWCRVINSHPQFDGISFVESESTPDGLPAYIECAIFRKDRRAVTRIREYMCEANTGAGAWLTHPRRMLRHKAMVQCARVCFGMGGVLEHDEAMRIQSTRKLHKAFVNDSYRSSQHIPHGTRALKEWLSSEDSS